MSNQEDRIEWVVTEFKGSHQANTSDAWRDVRHMVYAASQALLWHDDTPEAKQDREIYRLLGEICHINEIAAIDNNFMEAA